MAALDSPRAVGGFNKLRIKSGRVSLQMDQRKSNYLQTPPNSLGREGEVNGLSLES